MAITSRQIDLTVQDYLAKNSNERRRVQPLLNAINVGSNLATRTNFEGHVTCCAVLVDSAGRVLHIHHNTLGRWLLPGGHLEHRDPTLEKAALRELTEETGIPATAVAATKPFGATPIDIDAHRIPANPVRNEPEHWHFDVRYAFRTNGHPVTLQTSEVNSYRWLPVAEISSTEIRDKLARLYWQ